MEFQKRFFGLGAGAMVLELRAPAAVAEPSGSVFQTCDSNSRASHSLLWSPHVQDTELRVSLGVTYSDVNSSRNIRRAGLLTLPFLIVVVPSSQK